MYFSYWPLEGFGVSCPCSFLFSPIWTEQDWLIYESIFVVTGGPSWVDCWVPSTHSHLDQVTCGGSLWGLQMFFHLSWPRSCHSSGHALSAGEAFCVGGPHVHNVIPLRWCRACTVGMGLCVHGSGSHYGHALCLLHPLRLSWNPSAMPVIGGGRIFKVPLGSWLTSSVSASHYKVLI